MPNAVRSPNAPSMLHAELTPNNDVVLTWEAPTPSDDRAPVTGYRVYVQHADGRTEEHSPDTPSLSYRPVGLSSGTRYVFFVRALSERGLSEPSSSAFVDVPAVSVAPIAVPHLTVRADEGALRTLISWNHRAPEPPIVVTGFNLQYCEVTHGYDSDHCPNTDGWIPIGDLEMSATTREFIDKFDCSASSPRMYRIQALARVGSGPDEISSRYSDITPPICPSATYSPPRRVDAVFVADSVETRVNICWEVPEHNGGPVDGGYELQVTPDDVLPATEDDWLTVDAHIAPIRLGALSGMHPVRRFGRKRRALVPGAGLQPCRSWALVRTLSLRPRHFTSPPPALPQQCPDHERVLGRRHASPRRRGRGACVRGDARSGVVGVGDGELHNGGRDRESG